MQTIVRREQSNLIDNTICSYTDCCWKEAKQPDKQYYPLLYRLFVRDAVGNPNHSSISEEGRLKME